MYPYLLKHPELFQYAIGINYSQFLAILPKFSDSLRQAEARKAYSKIRLRDIGGGRKATLQSDCAKLFFVLLYYKAYPTFRFAQVLFGFDKRNVQLWKNYLAPVLFQSLGYELTLKKRLHRINSWEAWIEEYPQLKEFLVDATERPICRPKDNKLQEEYYSGKKKHHSIKNQILVDPKSHRILAVSDSVSGRIHDKTIFETDPLILRVPEDAHAMADLGYLGAEEINSRLKIILPQKKPKGKELTQTQKQNNKAISSIRVRVEHPFAYLKHFGILNQKYRGRIANKTNLDLPFKTIAAIYNFTRPPS